MAEETQKKIDKKDLRILYELDFNSRIPFSKLAKKVGLSQQVTDYRVRSLLSEGVIRGFMAVIEIHKLGYFTFRIYMRLQNLTPKKELGVFNYLKNHPNCVWFITTSGRWDLEALFSCRNPVQFNNIIKRMKSDLGRHIRDYNLSASVVNYHFKRSYLVGAERSPEGYFRYGFEPEIEELDDTEIRILSILSKDARKSNVDIGKATGLTYNAVKNRIKNLEERGILQGYRILIELPKIGRKYYKALISLQGIDEKIERKMYNFCALDSRVTYIVEVMGEWDIEIEAEVSDEEEFRRILVDFRDQFGHYIRDYDVLRVYKEHKMDYFPMTKELIDRIKCSKS
ncbi:MAG: Lrp/AsnC family transcriptional regulator [Candidatus Micrarchaeota archaeon]